MNLVSSQFTVGLKEPNQSICQILIKPAASIPVIGKPDEPDSSAKLNLPPVLLTVSLPTFPRSLLPPGCTLV